MSQSLLTALLLVIGIALLSLFLRRLGGAGTSGPRLPTSPEIEETIEEAEALAEDMDDPSGEVAAVTSDGWSFVPVGDGSRLQLLPPRVPPEPAEPGAPGTRHGPEQFARGDLIAARVRRGAPDHDPWRLEALGRDHDYRAWRFETEEAARAALDLVTRRTVRVPLDEYGEPVAVADADFDQARRREEEIEAELASMPEDPDSAPERRPIG